MSLQALMARWLNDADPVKRDHARRRLVQLGGVAPPVAPAASPPRPTVRAQHAANRTLLSCLYRDHHCGCSLPTCHARLGDHDDGAKSSREHCLTCLKLTWHLTETAP